MLQIACCDDELSVLNDLTQLLNHYRIERNLEVSYVAYKSPLELLSNIEKGIHYDILFLDVMMPGENGINTAKEIREYDQDVKIIFLTSSSEFAVESYSVKAFFYQMKPVRKESFYRIMDMVLEQYINQEMSNLVLKCKTGITKIALEQIEYCEVIGRNILIHMSGGKLIETNGTLDELSKELAVHKRFIRTHRSFLVNMDFIQTINYRTITMNSMTEIPIPRGKCNEIKEVFLKYAFNKAGNVSFFTTKEEN